MKKRLKFLNSKLFYTKKLIGVMIRRGNKERAVSFYASLIRRLKQRNRKQDPIKPINNGLSAVSPSFHLRDVFVAGKLFRLPVAISDNHSRYLGVKWFLKACNDNKSRSHFGRNLLKQLDLAAKRKGAAYSEYYTKISVALDQRPFSHYIRRRKKYRSKFKVTRGTQRNRKYMRKVRKISRSIRYRKRQLATRFASFKAVIAKEKKRRYASYRAKRK